MAMHSYMRANPNQSQTNNVSVTLSPDEMHSFLKDKQAWEHAISLYQGPDPLDHWYNYICWYENHARSDPEHKFRETLERCLTIYEHNEYYSQDVRLVRLWLKYIAMQTDQLRFYQVLFQRGTGRQVAAFYIGWASYYETREQFKDAEAVFNLAFQEKAQSNAELQSAHTKFNYVRSIFYQQQQLQQQQQQLHQQPPNNALQQLTTYTQEHHQQQQQAYPHSTPASASRSQQLSQETNFHPYQQHPPPELAYHPNAQQQQAPSQAHYQHQEQVNNEKFPKNGSNSNPFAYCSSQHIRAMSNHIHSTQMLQQLLTTIKQLPKHPMKPWCIKIRYILDFPNVGQLVN